MVSKTITYKDYDGVERTETFRFDLNEAEMTEMEYSEAGGLKQRIEKIVAAKNMPEVIALFKEILLISYGEKSDDGRHFIKVRNGHKLAEDFEQHKAFPILYMELATNEKTAADFIHGIVPQTK